MTSCSSGGSADPAPAAQASSGVQEKELSSGNNPFAFGPEDVQRGDDMRITGGKRSQFERQAESAYAKANADAPAYLQKDFGKKSWRGSRDFRTGSYQTASYRESGQQSRFAGRRLSEADRRARAAGQDFRTGSYRTGQANENGQVRPTGSSGYVDEQAADGWRQIQILEEDEYRSISIDQARSLLGR